MFCIDKWDVWFDQSELVSEKQILIKAVFIMNNSGEFIRNLISVRMRIRENNFCAIQLETKMFCIDNWGVWFEASQNKKSAKSFFMNVSRELMFYFSNIDTYMERIRDEII